MIMRHLSERLISAAFMGVFLIVVAVALFNVSPATVGRDLGQAWQAAMSVADAFVQTVKHG